MSEGPEPLYGVSRSGSVRVSTRALQILYLSPVWTERPTSATEIRAGQIARALQQLGHVEVVLLDDTGRDQLPAHRDDDFNATYSVHVGPHPNRTTREKIAAVINPHRRYPFGYAVDSNETGRVLRSAAECDLVWFFKLRTPDMFPQWNWERSVVDIDDVPSTYEHALLQSDCSRAERIRARLRLWTWRRREQLLGERFTVLCVCSETDKHYLHHLGVKASVHVIPNGYDRPTSPAVRKLTSPPRLGFIGVFDHSPNVAGIHWFVRHCWPQVKREVPDVRLRLVGRGSDGPLQPTGLDIDAIGYIPDPSMELATWSAMVVPLQLGAGTRGKIAHAFSQRCPVISTSLGAYGYDAEDGVNMFVVDSPEAFAAACVRAIRYPTQAVEIADRAWHQFLEKWTWDAITPRIWAAAEDCLRRTGAAARQ